jgi:hypothetical protein
MNWKIRGCMRSWRLPGGTKEAHEDLRLVRVLVEIRTEHLTDRSLERYL